MLSVLFEAPSFGLLQLFLGGRAVGAEVPGGFLCVNLHVRITGNHIVGYLNALNNFYSGTNDGIMFHIRHAHQLIDSLDAEPHEDVRHELLKAHVLNTSDTLGSQKVRFSTITALLALARIVNEEFGHLAKGTAFLAVISDNTYAPFLRCVDANFDTMSEVWSACTYIAAEYITAVAFVMNSARAGEVLVPELGRITKDIHGDSTNGWQKNVQISAGDELGKHTASLFKKTATEMPNFDTESFGNSWQMPHVFERNLRAVGGTRIAHDLSIDDEPSLEGCLLNLFEGNVRLRDRNGGPDVVLRQHLFEHHVREMTPGIYRHNTARSCPSRARGEVDHGLCVGEVGLEASRVSARSKGDGSVGGVRAVVRADGIFVHKVRGGGDDGAAFLRVSGSPDTRDGMDIELARMAGEYNRLDRLPHW